MFSNLELRFRDVIADIHETLIGISLDPRLMPYSAGHLQFAQRTARSSASTPSLRARDGSIPPHARADPGGNVRVVVRVRAFLPRGKSSPSVHCIPPPPLFFSFSFSFFFSLLSSILARR